MRYYYAGKVLKGKERKNLIDFIAFERAEFEIRYEGRKIEPFGRHQILRAIPEQYRDENGRITIHISLAFERQCQRRVAYCKQALQEFGDVKPLSSTQLPHTGVSPPS